MSDASFLAQMAPYAKQEAAATGLDCRLFLVQWALESAWGTSTIAVRDLNFAGIENSSGHGCSCCDGGYSICPSLADFLALYNAILVNTGYYTAVLATAGRSLETQFVALGNSPWAAGHYNDGDGPGSSLIALYGDDQALFDAACSASPSPSPSPSPSIPFPTPSPSFPSPSPVPTAASSDDIALVLFAGGLVAGTVYLSRKPTVQREWTRLTTSLRSGLSSLTQTTARR